MKKTLLFVSFMMLCTVFFAGCDNDSGSSYKFNGTVEVAQSPDGTSISLSDLADNHGSRLVFVATVKNTSGDIISNAYVSWGTINVSSNYMSFPGNNRMTIDVWGAAYVEGETIQVKASYGGVVSSTKTITFTA